MMYEHIVTVDGKIILIPARGRKQPKFRCVCAPDFRIILIPARGRKLDRLVCRDADIIDYTHPREGTETGRSQPEVRRES